MKRVITFTFLLNQFVWTNALLDSSKKHHCVSPATHSVLLAMDLKLISVSRAVVPFCFLLSELSVLNHVLLKHMLSLLQFANVSYLLK